MCCSCSTCLSRITCVASARVPRRGIGYVGNQMTLDVVHYAHVERSAGISLLLPPIALQTTLSVAVFKAGWTRASFIFFVKGPMNPSMMCVGPRLAAKALAWGENVGLERRES